MPGLEPGELGSSPNIPTKELRGADNPAGKELSVIPTFGAVAQLGRAIG